MLLLPSTEVALSNHCYRSHLLSSLGYCRPVFLTLACQRDEWLSQLMTDNKKPNLSSLFRACGFFYCHSFTNYSGVASAAHRSRCCAAASTPDIMSVLLCCSTLNTNCSTESQSSCLLSSFPAKKYLKVQA